MFYNFSKFALLFTFVTALGCGKETTNDRTAPQGDLTLMMTNGYQSLVLDDIEAITITVYEPRSTNIDLSVGFSDEKFVELIETLQLNSPTELGAVGAMISGEVFIQFHDSDLEDRRLNILNERLLEDSEFKEVYYTPLEKINREWLEAQ